MKAIARFEVLSLVFAVQAVLLNVFLCATFFPIATAQSWSRPSKARGLPSVGPGNIVVQPKFGGTILGFGIDASSNEGLLSEYVTLGNGNSLIATEIFDQSTGRILKVVAKQNQTQDDYVTLGVFGKHVGLDDYQHNGINSFLVLDPLNANRFTARWTPPIQKGYQLWSISNNQGTSNVAVATFENGGDGNLTVFRSNIAANTFGRKITIKDPLFGFYDSPVLAYDSNNNQAVLASSDGCRSCVPEIALINLGNGKIDTFSGVGLGFVNGIAVDSDKGLAVATTEIDAGVEFYDLATQSGFEVTLPCSSGGDQGFSGQDVEFDSLHNLFFVEQPYTTGCQEGSNIIVYDENGNVVETLEGFPQLPISPTLVALHPGNRTGFVFGDRTATTLRSFTY